MLSIDDPIFKDYSFWFDYTECERYDQLADCGIKLKDTRSSYIITLDCTVNTEIFKVFHHIFYSEAFRFEFETVGNFVSYDENYFWECYQKQFPNIEHNITEIYPEIRFACYTIKLDIFSETDAIEQLMRLRLTHV